MPKLSAILLDAGRVPPEDAGRLRQEGAEATRELIEAAAAFAESMWWATCLHAAEAATTAATDDGAQV